jgi:hypothetical protein
MMRRFGALCLRCFFEFEAWNPTSRPEVCGDATFADPKSPRRWLAQVKHLYSETNLARDLQTTGPRQAERFSWKTSAQAYLGLIASLRASRRNKKARLILPCDPRKLYTVERPLNRQERRAGSS